MNACSELDPVLGKLENITEMGNEVFSFKKGMLLNCRDNVCKRKPPTFTWETEEYSLFIFLLHWRMNRSTAQHNTKEFSQVPAL